MTPSEMINSATMVFQGQNDCVSFTVSQLEFTSTLEPNRSEVVTLTIPHFLDDDRKRLQGCTAPQSISIDWGHGHIRLKPEKIEAAITPCEGISYLRGVFTENGFDPFDGGVLVPIRTLNDTFSPPVCEVKIMVRLRSPTLRVERKKIGSSKAWAV